MNNFGPKGRREVVFAARDRIADLYLSGRAFTSLMAEYKCSYEIIKSALLSVISSQQYADQRHKILCRGGEKYRFTPGQKPWNKGVYMRVSPGTEFKRGHLPKNTQEVGQVVCKKDQTGKYARWIKVSDQRRGGHKWITLAAYLWQVAHGPIPPGKFVIHENGVRLDDRPENLIAVTQAEHMNLTRKRGGGRMERLRRKNMKKAGRNRRRKTSLDRQYKKQAKKRFRDLAIPPRIFWECTSCGENYEGRRPPLQCSKCNRGGFERIKVPQKMAV